jgi:hypothetical protein
MLTIYTLRRLFCVAVKKEEIVDDEESTPLLDPEREAVNTLLLHLGNRSPPLFSSAVIEALHTLCSSSNIQLRKSAALAINEISEIDTPLPVPRGLVILIFNLLSCEVFYFHSLVRIM